MVFVRLRQVDTLDDDLVGTRVTDQQMKTLSILKEKSKGQMAVVLADSLYNCILAI